MVGDAKDRVAAGPDGALYFADRLNKIGRVKELPDNPSTRGMIDKVAHLVRVVEGK